MVRRAARVFRVLTLVLMSGVAMAAVVIAADPLRHFRELSQGTLLYYTISLVGGAALLVCLLLALGFPAKARLIALPGLAITLALAINHLMGLRLSTILCFTPS